MLYSHIQNEKHSGSRRGITILLDGWKETFPLDALELFPVWMTISLTRLHELIIARIENKHLKRLGQ
jgi:hypothetical protein